MDIENLKRQLETDYYLYDYILTYRTYNAWGKTYYLDFCILTDKQNLDKKVIRLQKRFFGITNAMKEKGETQPRWIIYDTFNLNPVEDFPSFYDIIRKYKEGKLQEVSELVHTADFDVQVKRIRDLSKELKTYSRKRTRTRKENDELKRKQAEIERLLDKLNSLYEDNRKLRLQAFKTNINKYREIITDLKKNLDKKANNEAYFQSKLSQNKWIFGPWYEDVLPKRKADTKNEPDFILKRYDGFADIVEIEAPGKKLFTSPNKSKKSQPRSELIQALTQVIDYIDSYNEHFKDEFYTDVSAGIENPLNPYRPRGILIIGRDIKGERKKLRQLNSFLNHVIIITYDEFLKNAESIINLLEKRKV